MCTIEDFADVVAATQALALLVIGSDPSPSPSSLTDYEVDSDVSDPDTPLKIGSEGMLSDERKEEAEAALTALGTSNEKSTYREVCLFVQPLSYYMTMPI